MSSMDTESGLRRHTARAFTWSVSSSRITSWRMDSILIATLMLIIHSALLPGRKPVKRDRRWGNHLLDSFKDFP